LNNFAVLNIGVYDKNTVMKKAVFGF